MRAFKSEWIKLSRRTSLLGFGGATIGLSLLFTVLTFISAGGGNVDLEGGQSDDFVTSAALSMADGAVFSFTSLASFIGIIALTLFASNMAGEFNKGTIRTLFVTEPRRLKLLSGKMAALASFTAACVAAALAVSIGAGALLAPGAGVDTAMWWTTDGLTAIVTTYANLTLAAMTPALIGAALAVITRSAAIAISVGVAWFILGEGLVAVFWTSLGEWGPAAVTNALAVGGAGGPGLMGGPRPIITYSVAALLAVGYSILALAISSATFVRRDVTS